MSTMNHTTPGDGPQLTNGQVARHVNGHGKESAPAEAPPSGSAKRVRSRAASDDAHGTPVAPASVPPAASATHDACADAARDSSGKQAEQDHAGPSARSGAKRIDKEPPRPLPPGELPLPEDAFAFVSAVHEKADIIEAGRRLLNSGDEKIVKGVWDRLVNLRFGNDEEQSSEGPQRIVIDIPGAQREWPDEE